MTTIRFKSKVLVKLPEHYTPREHLNVPVLPEHVRTPQLQLWGNQQPMDQQAYSCYKYILSKITKVTLPHTSISKTTSLIRSRVTTKKNDDYKPMTSSLKVITKKFQSITQYIHVIHLEINSPVGPSS